MADTQRTISIVVKAQDDASAVFNRFSRTLKDVAREVEKQPITAALDVREGAARDKLDSIINSLQDDAKRQAIVLQTQDIAERAVRLDPDLRGELVKQRLSELVADLNAKARQQRIQFEAVLIDHQARRQLAALQEELKKPLRPAFDLPEQQVRNEMARIIRDMRDQARAANIKIDVDATRGRADERLFGPNVEDEREFARHREELSKRIEDDARRRIAESRLRRDIGGPLTATDVARESRERFLRTAQDQQQQREAQRRRAVTAGTGDGDFLQQLKGGFGRGSRFNEIIELAAGGGVLVGLSRAAEAVERTAAGVRTFADGLRDGDKTAGQITDQFLRQVPILGSLYAAGRNLRDVFTGEEHALARANAEAADLEKTISLQRAAWAEVRKSAEGTADAIARMQRESARIGAAGVGAEDIGGRIGAIERAEAIRQQFQQRADAEVERTRNRLTELRRQANQTEARDNTGIQPAAVSLAGANPALSALARTAAANAEAANTEAARSARTQAANLARSTAADLKQLADQRQQQLRAADDLAAREQLDRDIRHATERRKLLESLERETAQTITTTRIDALRAAGQGQRADLAEVDQQLKERRRQIREETEAQVEADKANRNPIQQRGNDRLIAADLAAAQQRRDINRKYQDQVNTDEFSHQRELADINATAAAERLRAMGLDFEAQAAERRRAFDREREEIEQNRKEQIRTDAEHTTDHNRRAAERTAAVENEFEAKERLAERERTQRQGELRLPSLSDAGLATGAGQAARERALTDLRQFGEREQAERRRQIERDEFDRLAADARVPREPPPAFAGVGLPPGFERLLADVRVPSAIGDDDKSDKFAEDTAKNTSDTAKQLETIRTLLTNLPGGIGAAVAAAFPAMPV